MAERNDREVFLVVDDEFNRHYEFISPQEIENERRAESREAEEQSGSSGETEAFQDSSAHTDTEAAENDIETGDIQDDRQNEGQDEDV